MPTLQDRLADLAEEAPETPTPAGLSAEGRRRVRIRRVGTTVLVAAVVLGLLGVGGFTAHRAAQPPVAAASSGPALPTQVHAPSPWLPGTGAHPPGRLSMVIPAERGTWTGHRWGVVGVSATSGTYLFLDIPGCLQFAGLSPDGRHVACYSGTGSGHDAVLEGLLVYDTGIGHVDSWTPAPGSLHLNSVAWNGNDAVTVRAGQTSYLWRFGDGAPRPIGERLRDVAGTTGVAGLYPAGPALADPTVGPSGRFFFLDPSADGRRTALRIRYPPGHASVQVVASPNGRQVAMEDRSPRGSTLYVGTVDRPGARTVVHAVPTALRWPTLVGWTDNKHLAVVNQVSPASEGVGYPGARYELARVDVTTGAIEHVSDLGSLGGTWITFASSTLGAPTQDFPAPPRPLGPRVVSGLVVGLLVLGGVALVWWRRRVRA